MTYQDESASKISVGLITTKATNIGDDLIRVGVERLLECLFPPSSLEFRSWNKHDPWTLYSRSGSGNNWVGQLPRGKWKAASLVSGVSRLMRLPTAATNVDLVVQAGTPVMWTGLSQSEWQRPLWDDVLSRSDVKALVIGLAGGSSFAWTGRDSVYLDREDRLALSKIAATAEIVSVRDEIAQELFESVGARPRLLPCTAMHAGRGNMATLAVEQVMFNVMPRGGHFAWGQALDEETWLTAIGQVVRFVARDHEVVFVCHSADEYELARSRWPEYRAVFPRSTHEYLEVCRTMALGVVNRMHAAVALAGVGVPALAIGTDTRLLMVRQAGQQIMYLGDADAEAMLAAFHDMVQERNTRREFLVRTESQAFDEHLSVLRSSTLSERFDLLP